MSKTPRERIDAEVARELLNLSTPQAEEIDGERDAALFWRIQQQICKGPRAAELAALHAQVRLHPEDRVAQNQRDALLTAIAEEALAHLQALDEN